MCEVIQFPLKAVMSKGKPKQFGSPEQQAARVMRLKMARQMVDEAIDNYTSAGMAECADWLEAAAYQIDCHIAENV